jgi:hypothetical protein
MLAGDLGRTRLLWGENPRVSQTRDVHFALLIILCWGWGAVLDGGGQRGVVSSLRGLCLLSSSSAFLSSCNNKTCLQTRPHVPWG